MGIRLSLVGCTINPAAVRGVLTIVETEAEQLTPARKAIRDDIAEGVGSVRLRSMAGSLSGLWHDVIALQAEAAETRTAGAVSSMRSVVNAYIQGDENMMDAAEKKLLKTPNLTIDDGIAVDQ